jgi:hypothetical protein
MAPSIPCACRVGSVLGRGEATGKAEVPHVPRCVHCAVSQGPQSGSLQHTVHRVTSRSLSPRCGSFSAEKTKAQRG